MWYRLAAITVVALNFTSLVSAQVAGVYSRAVPPDPKPLARLNLKTDWTLYLPMEGRRDTIATVQTVDNDQVFVQSRTGLLGAIDVRTGQLQWWAALGNNGYVNIHAVAVNSKFVYAVNVTKLYAFHRYTGVTEFVVDLGSSPTTGLAADESGVYMILSMRPGSSGAARLAVYDLPRPLGVVDAAQNAALDPKNRDPNLVNPVDDVATRYPAAGIARSGNSTEFAPIRRGSLSEVPVSGLGGSRTPSLSALPIITPPYRLEGSPVSPSLGTLPSLRQPYRMRNDFQRDIQQTPSLSTIPPSVAAALALTDLRPQGIKPPIRWEYGMTSRVLFPPLLTPYRVWLALDDRTVVGLSKFTKETEVVQHLLSDISAPVGQGGTNAYVPLSDGNLFAYEGTTGNKTGGATLLWRAQPGGIMSRMPLVTDDAVFAAGDNSGVVRVDRKTGVVIWRSDSPIDRVVAVNQEFAYLSDRQGRFYVFDALRATDKTRKYAAPLTGIDLSEFNVPVTNTVSDRIFLAADNGLVVCLRDASPKYARPVRMCPEAIVDPPVQKKVEAAQVPGN